MRILISILFMFFVSLSPPGIAEGQTLSNEALSIEQSNPEVFKAVKEAAVDQWQDDHVMVVAEINQQVESIYKLFHSVDLNDPTQNRIFANAFNKWKLEDYNSLEDNAYSIKCNWVMVLAEFRQQLAANNSINGLDRPTKK